MAGTGRQWSMVVEVSGGPTGTGGGTIGVVSTGVGGGRVVVGGANGVGGVRPAGFRRSS